MSERDKIIQILKDRGITESELAFESYIYVVNETDDHYEVAIDGTFIIKKPDLTKVDNLPHLLNKIGDTIIEREGEKIETEEEAQREADAEEAIEVAQYLDLTDSKPSCNTCGYGKNIHITNANCHECHNKSKWTPKKKPSDPKTWKEARKAWKGTWKEDMMDIIEANDPKVEGEKVRSVVGSENKEQNEGDRSSSNSKPSIGVFDLDKPSYKQKIQTKLTKEKPSEPKFSEPEMEKLWEGVNTKLRVRAEALERQTKKIERAAAQYHDCYEIEKENEALRERIKILEESKISTSKVPKHWVDEAFPESKEGEKPSLIHCCCNCEDNWQCTDSRRGCPSWKPKEGEKCEVGDVVALANTDTPTVNNHNSKPSCDECRYTCKCQDFLPME